MHSRNKQYSYRARLALFVFCLAPALSQGGSPGIAAGRNHTLAVASDGTVYAWGKDNNGQLGLGTNTFSGIPQQVAGLVTQGGTGSPAISAGGYHSILLMPDGTVWTWGNNDTGQLGDGTTLSRGSPAKVAGLAAVTAVAGGGAHTLALKADGTLWTWGSNGFGALGDGTNVDKKVPVQVTTLSSVKGIAGGGSFSVAVKSDGTVWTWGANFSGQLGDGTTTNRVLPMQVQGLTGVSAIAAGQFHALALKSDGTVWAWGANTNAELGDGTTTNRFTPVRVSGLTSVSSISAGDGHSLAVRTDATLWTWGKNIWGQIGDGTNTSRAIPVQVMTGVASAKAGGKGNGAAHTLAIKTDGGLWAWGYNGNGQLGDGGTTDRRLPVQIGGVFGISAISGGSLFSMALKSDGSVLTWGNDDRGQLGNRRELQRSIPTQVVQIAGVTAVSASQDHSLALKSDGSVWAWGSNFSGELGDGTSTNRATPAQVVGLAGVIAVAAGVGRSVAVKSDGSVWAWGLTFDGGSSKTPVQVPVLTSVVAVSQGVAGMLALKSDGTVWEWGTALITQPVTLTASKTPTQVQGLSGIIGISGSFSHALALKSDGTVWAWGYNGDGQLGDGTTTTRTAPLAVQGVSGVVAVAAGSDHSLALGSDGSIWAWGNGPRGDGTMSYRSPPRNVPGFTGVVAVTAGAHRAALKSDGSVLTWGFNDSGQIGDGTLAYRLAPALVVGPAADGFLGLKVDTTIQVPPELKVPFFVVASGGIASTSASVSTTTRFNASDIGKAGEVYVTATVPAGTLASGTNPLARSATARTASTSGGYELIQLTSTGWQIVVNGQLLPYASGVLGNQLAAQTILNGTDTSSLKGAQFCLGYGTSAANMIAAGTMRVVATIPDPSVTDNSTISCIAGVPLSYSLSLSAGWNLLGNSLNQTLSVASLFGDAGVVNTVWKWDASGAAWQIYAPSLDATALQNYAATNKFRVLSVIKPGEGYWVNAKVPPSLPTQSGSAFGLAAGNLAQGWNLVATGNDITPNAFEMSLKAASRPGVITLWAWESSSSKWYFYAPSLETQGSNVLRDYITSRSYLDFVQSGKTLGKGTGFWVNR